MARKMDGGGPAFPTEPNTQPGFYVHHGMSLRDWFAGQALSVLATRLDFEGEEFARDPEDAATLSYRMADAMLEARK